MTEGNWITTGEDYYEYEDAEMQEKRFLKELYEEDDDWSLMRELDIMGQYEND